MNLDDLIAGPPDAQQGAAARVSDTVHIRVAGLVSEPWRHTEEGELLFASWIGRQVMTISEATKLVAHLELYTSSRIPQIFRYHLCACMVEMDRTRQVPLLICSFAVYGS